MGKMTERFYTFSAYALLGVDLVFDFETIKSLIVSLFAIYLFIVQIRFYLKKTKELDEESKKKRQK